MRYYLGFFLLCWISPLPASQADTMQIRRQYLQALQGYEERDYTLARSIAQGARKSLLGSESQHLDLVIRLNYILADCALETGYFAKGLTHLLDVESLLRSQRLTEGLYMAEALHKIGYYYQETKDYKQAIPYFEGALEIRRKFLGPRHLKIADGYNNLGICQNALGDHDKALEFHDQALSIRQEMLPALHPQLAQSYNNLAICMEHKGEYQLALSNYQKAIDYYRKIYGARHLALADVYLNAGPVYQVLGEPQRNIYFLREALSIYRQHLGEDHPSLALCYNNLANAYVEMEDFREARSMYEKALEIRSRRYGTTHPDVAQTYFNLGICHLRQGETEAAAAVFQQCFAALNYQAGQNPALEQVNDHYILILLLFNLSELQKEHYKTSGSLQGLLQALEYYRQADHLIDFLRTRYETIGAKLELADLSHQLYDLAITLAIDLFDLTGEESYRETAFRFAEKSKGMLLLEALNKTEAEYFAGVPDTLVGAIKDLEHQIAELEKIRYLSWEKLLITDDDPIDSLNNLIFDKKQMLSGLIGDLKRTYPRYYDLRYNTATVPVERIQQELLEPGQSMVEYFLGDAYLHIFVIKKNAFEVFRIPVTGNFQIWLNTFRSAIRQFPNVPTKELPENIRLYLRSAYSLYQTLVQPVEHLLEEQLIIIPDGELGLLPFAALISVLPDTVPSFQGLAYLLQDYTISYNYSATLLREMKDKKRRPQMEPYLGFAPVFEPDNSNGLARLRFNETEVQRVKQLIGGQIFTGQAATKSNFLAHQAGYKIVHLATHGKADHSGGNYAFLAFSEPPSDPGKEALLYGAEIYGLSSQAELIVLSACETGTGALQQGEGIASLARGFSYAGARSIVATQWNVEDQTTNELIYRFFKKLKAGQPKDKALREAELEAIAAGDRLTAHPYFWAAFIPIGDMEPLALGPAIHPATGLIPLVLLCCAGFILRRRKRAQLPGHSSPQT